MSVTPMTETLDEAMDAIRRHKEHRVADAGGDQRKTASFGVIHLYRADLPVAFVMLPANRDMQVVLARVAAYAFGADTISLALDAYVSHLTENPLTGRPWRDDEQQEVAEQHDGLAKGWVFELQWVVVANRAGDVAEAVMRYRTVDGTVQWDTAEVHNPAVSTGGVVESLRQIMTDGDLSTAAYRTGLDREWRDLDPEQARAYLDCAAVRVITERLAPALGITAAVTLPVQTGSVRHEVIAASLGDTATVHYPHKEAKQ